MEEGHMHNSTDIIDGEEEPIHNAPPELWIGCPGVIDNSTHIIDAGKSGHP